MEKILPDHLVWECLVLKTRHAARTITRRYNAAVKPFGLLSTQVSLLFCLAQNNSRSIREMADQLDLERSALTRNLRLLSNAGLIDTDQQGQGKLQRFHLTAAGKEKLHEVLPAWQSAQDAVRRELGETQWQYVQSSLSRINHLD